jgi:hypothetical protein
MLGDLSLLTWLRARHAWTQLVFWMYATGADIESGDLFERFYELYLVVLFSAWALGMSIVSIAQIGQSFAELSATQLDAVRQGAMTAPLLVLAALFTRSLRRSPVQLTAPDIAYVAATQISTRALVAVDTAIAVLKAGTLGAVLGTLFGSGMYAAGAGATPGAGAALASLMAVVLVIGARVVGMARLTVDRWLSQWWWMVVWPAVGLVVVTRHPVLEWTAYPILTALEGGSLTTTWTVLGLLVLLETVLLMAISPRADVTRIIDDSALFAELAPLQLMRVLDSAGYREIARSKRRATRRPRLHPPIGQGEIAPVSRAVLSYVRQPLRLFTPLVWGALVVPVGVLLLPWRVSGFGYLPWMAVALSGLSAELTRVFRDDLQHPTIRRALPFDTLTLLLLDSAPATVLAAALSIAVITVFQPPGGDAVGEVALAVLLTVLAVLCRGIGLLEHSWTSRTVSFQSSMLLSLGLIVASALLGGVWLAVIAAASAAWIAVMIVRWAHE